MSRYFLGVLFGFLFIGTGILHFVHPATYLKIMPPYLPFPAELVFISGVFEVGLGVLVMIPQTKWFASWGLILLLIAVFPANIQMTLHPEQFPQIPQWILWARLPLQFVLIAWAWWVGRG
jgi:uncharacterized membrane protein